MRRYVPDTVLSWLSEDLSDWLAVLRPMSVLFVGLSGLDYDQASAIDQLNHFFNEAQKNIEHYKGTINKLVEYCEYVYIDTDMGERADMYLDTAPATSSVQVKQRLASNRLAEDILNASKKPVVYSNTKTTIEELPAAKEAFKKATNCVAQVMEQNIVSLLGY